MLLCLRVPHLVYPFICPYHLGFIYVLTIVHDTAVNIGVHLSFKIMVFSGSVPRNGVAVTYGTSLLSFSGPFVLFSFVDFLTVIPTNS